MENVTEKAREIVRSMRKTIYGDNGMIGGFSQMAKQCALIATEEMLNYLHDIGYKTDCPERQAIYDLQAEIEKL